MTSLPIAPVLVSPFAQDGDKGKDFVEHGDVSTISYKYGIPIGYCVPNSNGGSKFTREEMNRIGYIATYGAYLAQCGIPITFSKAVSDAISGYPKGAILKYVSDAQGIIEDVISLKDDNTNDFRDDPRPYEPFVTYMKGMHVTVPSSTYDGAVYRCMKCTSDVGKAQNTDWDNVKDHFSEDPDYVGEVKGPDGVNWGYVHKSVNNFWPSHEINYDFPKWRQETVGTAIYDGLAMSKTGWLYLRVDRTGKVEDTLKSNSLQNCLMTNVKLVVKSRYMSKAAQDTYSVGLGLLSSNSTMIPLVEGTTFAISVESAITERIRLSYWELETVQ